MILLLLSSISFCFTLCVTQSQFHLHKLQDYKLKYLITACFGFTKYKITQEHTELLAYNQGVELDNNRGIEWSFRALACM